MRTNVLFQKKGLVNLERFKYVARTATGELQEGTLDAESLREAAGILREQGMFVIKLLQSKGDRTFFPVPQSAGNPKYAALFCRQLSVMLDEQPLNEILDMLSKQKGDRKYREMVQGIRQQIEMGKNLSEAMGKFREFFPANVIHIVEAGQESGSLSNVLERLADFLEKEYAARQKLESAMLYPILIGIAVICAICFMVVFILPTFVVLFENFQTELPLPTRILLALGRFAEVHGMWIPVITALAFAGFVWILRQETVRYFIDYWILRIPFIGSWRQDTEWMHILSTLAVELESGMRIDVALRMVREVPSNRYLRQFLGELEESVSHGYPLVHILGACPVFPPMLLELIAAGENTGRLEEMLRKAADYCELSSENFSQRLQAMAEPSMLLLLGGVVMGFVLSIVLPLMEMMDQAM